MQNRNGLDQGHYYGPGVGVGGYTAAKQDFVTRSGLIPRSALFTPEQLTEIYFCIDSEVDGSTQLQDKRRETLQGIASQLKDLIPDIAERAEQSFRQDMDVGDMPCQGQSLNM